jgi:hypothetical protein
MGGGGGGGGREGEISKNEDCLCAYDEKIETKPQDSIPIWKYKGDGVDEGED